jgi:hypothetical protein
MSSCCALSISYPCRLLCNFLSNCLLPTNPRRNSNREDTRAFLLTKYSDTGISKCKEPFLSEIQILSAIEPTEANILPTKNVLGINLVSKRQKSSSDNDEVINFEDMPIECVICLDEFTAENPSMLTLCTCGENRTYFHYQCLLLWLQRKCSCPNCGSRLYYQVYFHIPHFFYPILLIFTFII